MFSFQFLIGDSGFWILDFSFCLLDSGFRILGFCAAHFKLASSYFYSYAWIIDFDCAASVEDNQNNTSLLGEDRV